MKHTLSALMLASLAAFVQPAMAAADAKASLSSFTITLVDLDLDDGIAPSITFLGTGYGNGLFFSAQNNVDQDVTFDSALAESGSTATFVAQGSASVTGAATAAGAYSGPDVMSTSAFAFIPSGTPATSDLTDFSASSSLGLIGGGYGNIFNLSANTLAVFSAQATLTARVDRRVQSGFFDVASAGLTFRGEVNIPGGTQSFLIDQGVFAANSADDTSTWDEDFILDVWESPIYGSLVNPTASTIDGYLQFDMAASAYMADYNPLLIPEPSTFALGLIGLAGLGVVAKRRRLA